MNLHKLFDNNTKVVNYEGEDVVVSTEAFQKILFDDNDNYISDTANELDEEIFFYLSEEDFNLPNEEIAKLLKKYIS